MKDNQGHEYSDLLAHQMKHLDLWAGRVRPNFMKPIAEYVLKHNVEANDSNQRHRVFRGQDIVQIIMDWPNLNLAYPPVKDDPRDLI